MKKLILVFNLFIVTSVFAQFNYSVTFDPVGIFKENKGSKVLQLYDAQLSLKSVDGIFFFEIQPGIILSSIIPHANFFLGGRYKMVYLKGGIFLYADITEEGPVSISGF